MLIWVVVGAYLTIGSIYDKKCLLLPSWFLRIGCLMGTAWGLYRVFMEQIPWQQWITACLPGILWIILAFATRCRYYNGTFDDGVSYRLCLGDITFNK